jgi:uncharacterized cupin superfamily protein
MIPSGGHSEHVREKWPCVLSEERDVRDGRDQIIVSGGGLIRFSLRSGHLHCLRYVGAFPVQWLAGGVGPYVPFLHKEDFNSVF